MAQFENLPGLNITLNDGGLVLPDNAVTESLLILAPSTSDNAPEEPIRIRQSSQLREYGFGDYANSKGEENHIAVAWKQATEGGCRNVFLAALKGETKTEQFAHAQEMLFGVLSDFDVDHVAFYGVWADAPAEDIQQEDLNEDFQDEYQSSPGISNFGYVAEGQTQVQTPISVTTDANSFGIIPSETDVVEGEDPTITITLSTKEYDGTNNTIETLQADLNTELEAVSEMELRASIENGIVSIIGDAEFTLVEDDTAPALTLLGIDGETNALYGQHTAGPQLNGDFAMLLSAFANEQMTINGGSIAYIGVQPAPTNSLRDVRKHADHLATMASDYSAALQIVGAPDFGYRIPGRSGELVTSGVVSYAALATTLELQNGTTNKQLAGVSSVNYRFSARQLNRITGNNVVTFQVKNGGVFVARGVTTAPRYMRAGQRQDSDYRALSTVRIAMGAVQAIQDAVDPFVGNGIRPPEYSALKGKINAALKTLEANGALVGSNYSISPNGSIHDIQISLSLQPVGELRHIDVDVSMNAGFALRDSGDDSDE